MEKKDGLYVEGLSFDLMETVNILQKKINAINEKHHDKGTPWDESSILTFGMLVFVEGITAGITKERQRLWEIIEKTGQTMKDIEKLQELAFIITPSKGQA